MVQYVHVQSLLSVVVLQIDQVILCLRCDYSGKKTDKFSKRGLNKI